MAVSYEFKGKKGSRKVVKTIDIHEDSYNAISQMLKTGINMTEGVCDTLIDDVYHIFGGNIFGDIINFSLDHTLKTLETELFEAGIFKDNIEPSDIHTELLNTLVPCMCYSGDTSLHFFNEDKEEVFGMLEKIIKPKYLKGLCTDNLNGQNAFGILIYLTTITEENIGN